MDSAVSQKIADGRAWRTDEAQARRRAEARAGKATCGRCRRRLPLDQFYHARKVGGVFRRSWCRECSRAAARDYRLLAAFNLTAEDYDAIIAEQGGGCAICGREDADATGASLPVDHDHKTGLVRGALCTYHNRLLTPAVQKWMAAYAHYLADPPATRALGREVFGVKGPAVKHRRGHRYQKRRP